MNDLITRRLRTLDEEYTAAVNAAIDENRDDLVRVLVAEYPNRAAAVLGGSELVGMAA